jgi:hypothetical protein
MDDAYSVGLAWGKNYANYCCSLLEKKNDITVDEIKLIPSSRQEVKALCDIFRTNLQARLPGVLDQDR